MTERERMEAGLIYDCGSDDIMPEQMQYQDALWRFNHLGPSEFEERQELMKEIFAECGENTFLQGPVNSNWGGRHVHLGSNIYANFNLTLVDDGHIYIGDWAQFGPNVTLTTAGHPVLPELRTGYGTVLQFNKDIHIGENAWLGAGVTVLPGVTIGEGTVIGAGSVVTRDIPANVVAVGNPCRVMREIGDRDREYFYKKDRVDWEEIRKRYSK
ncbi:MAG: sugar O-acetyltransferase [Mogibacterium sp.]|nr:sugar O-acetyltransferase [Mogibacterium sp.]